MLGELIHLCPPVDRSPRAGRIERRLVIGRRQTSGGTRAGVRATTRTHDGRAIEKETACRRVRHLFGAEQRERDAQPFPCKQIRLAEHRVPSATFRLRFQKPDLLASRRPGFLGEDGVRQTVAPARVVAIGQRGQRFQMSGQLAQPQDAGIDPALVGERVLRRIQVARVFGIDAAERAELRRAQDQHRGPWHMAGIESVDGDDELAGFLWRSRGRAGRWSLGRRFNIRSGDAHVVHRNLIERHAQRTRNNDVFAVGEEGVSRQHVHEVSRQSELWRGSGRRFERHLQSSDNAGGAEAPTPGESCATILLFELERLGGQRSSGPEVQPEAPSRVAGLRPHDRGRAGEVFAGKRGGDGVDSHGRTNLRRRSTRLS